MMTKGQCRRLPGGLVLVPAVDDNMRHLNVYIPYGASSDTDIDKVLAHIRNTQRGKPPPEDFHRGR